LEALECFSDLSLSRIIDESVKKGANYSFVEIPAGIFNYHFPAGISLPAIFLLHSSSLNHSGGLLMESLPLYRGMVQLRWIGGDHATRQTEGLIHGISRSRFRGVGGIP
jgi:hypothetical protein